MIGDLWRWGLRRADPDESDLDRSWRQTVRWLVGDVPGRVDVSVRPKADATSPAVDIRVAGPRRRVPAARQRQGRPPDHLPDGETLTLDAEPDGREAGSYAATYVTKLPGAYRVVATATAPDGAPSANAKPAGPPSPPPTNSPASSRTATSSRPSPRRPRERWSTATGWTSFVASLSSRDAPITEPWISPLWHQPLYFLIAIACLTAEWGIRRVNGLA